MKNLILGLIALATVLVYACKDAKNNTETAAKANEQTTEKTTKAEDVKAEKKMASLAEMLAKAEVPVLCYHHIRTFDTRKSLRMKEYEVTPEGFAAQMKALSENGYHTILPEQLYNYLTMGDTLPSKPIMLTYDDTDEEQFSIAKPEMDKYGFKGVYFMMTIPIDRPNYMTEKQIRQLADEGHVVADHTWDHHKVTKYTSADWDKQLLDSKKELEAIAGKSVQYFAYPFGLWNREAIEELKKRDYKLAFILSTKRDTLNPLHTIRRTIVPGTWSPEGMIKAIKATFHLKE